MELKIKELRVKQGYTQAELARLLKLSPSALAMYERGERKPDIETIDKLAQIFNVDLNVMVGKASPTPLKLSDKQKLLLELFDEVGEDEQEQEKVINLIKVALGKYDL